jgi:prepilin-type N-terminal cleavage/methylation domain-containing protein
MLPTKLKAKNFQPGSAGFTMIEMIVVVSILGLVAVMTSGFLLVSLTAAGKAEVTKEVRQNGNYALSVMEGIILNSRGVGCTSPNTVNVTDADGNLTTFLCQDNKISSISAVTGEIVNLTAPIPNLIVSGCDFSCPETPGRPTKVHLRFIIGRGDPSSRPGEKASLEFQTEIVPRNLN